jgi:hypothetical protein
VNIRRIIPSLWNLAGFLYVQRIKGFDVPMQPHLDDEASAFLTEQLPNTSLFLEYGSGGSTVLANRLGVPTISVESDRFFAEAVRKGLPNPQITRILVPRMGLTREWGMPIFDRPNKGHRYVMAPFQELHGRFPDLISIDGRYRVACALMCARKAAEAGASARLMFDDYADRPWYHGVEEVVGTPKLIGRAALFDLDGRKDVPQKLVDEYATDWR